MRFSNRSGRSTSRTVLAAIAVLVSMVSTATTAQPPTYGSNFPQREGRYIQVDDFDMPFAADIANASARLARETDKNSTERGAVK